MKFSKILMVVGVLGALAVAPVYTARAQQQVPIFKGQSLIGSAQALFITNVVAVTNISLPSSLGTNKSGTIFTNRSGVLVDCTNSVNQNTKLLAAADLWALRDGSPLILNNFTNLSGGWTQPPGLAQVSYAFVGQGANANSALQVTLTPAWDGTNVDNSGAYDWTFGITANGATAVIGSTNAPTYKWIGAKKIVCTRIVNADADATSGIWLTSLVFGGFPP